jgi:lipopolysaccharide/colanic/teichoic acid biosynthesis glycosyltransferase
MRAVLIATGYHQEMASLLEYRPSPLLNIVSKPILFYVIEYLHEAGIKQCDLILSHLPDTIEEAAMEGKRWGISLTYHLSKHPKEPYRALLPVVKGWKDEMILLGSGDRLPRFEEKISENSHTTLFYYPNHEWSLWGVLPVSAFATLSQEMGEEELPKALTTPFRKGCALPFLSVRSFHDLKGTNIGFLTQQDNGQVVSPLSQRGQDQVWISRAVSIHPSVILRPPVFIGENCQIREGVRLGPNAVVEQNCIIDKKSVVEESLICQRSYVGEGLVLRNTIVDRNLLVNLSLKTHIHISDDFILSEIPSLHTSQFFLAHFMERCLAGWLLLILSPLFLILSLCYKLNKTPVLSLPTTSERKLWHSFNWMNFQGSFFQNLPVLWNIVKGDAHFVGLIPRKVEEVEKLPNGWKSLYLKGKVGMIHPTLLEHGPHPSADDWYASEAYYVTHMGWRHDLKWIALWIKCLFV